MCIRDRLLQKKKTQIPEAATEHSESSNATKEDKTKESRSQYQKKPHPKPKEAAPNTKGSSSQNQRTPLPIPRKRARTASPDPEEVRGWKSSASVQFYQTATEHVLISERILMIRYWPALLQSMLSSMCSLGSNCLVRDASHLCSSENEHAEMRFQQILTQTCISISVPLS